MVCGNHHQGFSIFLGPLEDGADHFIKVKEFLAHVTHLVAVAPVVNLGAFHHEEEAFLVVQHLNGFHGAFHEDGAAVQAGFEVVFVVQAQEFVTGGACNVFQLVHIGVSLGLHLFNEVAAVAALVPEVGAAAGDEVHIGIDVLGGQAFLILAGRAVDAEIGRRGVVDAAGDGNARLHAFHALAPLEVGLHGLTLCIEADVAVLGLLAVRQGGTAGAGVGDELVGGIGAGIAGHRHVVNVEGAAIGYPAHAPLAKAGTVADHEDDVLDLLSLGLLHAHSLIGGFHLVFVVLGEGVGGILGAVAVQLFGSLGKGLQGAQRQDNGKNSFHCYSVFAFQPANSTWAFLQPSGRVQCTVQLSPGSTVKKLSLQKVPGMRLPLSSLALRMF